MSERKGERIRRVRRGRLGKGQQALHHFGHGELLGRAVAYDGLFDLARGEFVDLQTRFGDGRQGGPASFPHHQRRLQILSIKEAFHDADCRLMLLEHVAQGPHNSYQAPGMFPAGRAGERAMGQCPGAGFGQLNDSVTGAAQGGIETEDDLMGPEADARSWPENGHCSAAHTAEALLHLLELVGRDAHAQTMSVAACGRKEKRGTECSWVDIANYVIAITYFATVRRGRVTNAATLRRAGRIALRARFQRERLSDDEWEEPREGAED